MSKDYFAGKSLIYADPRVLSLESSWTPGTEVHEPRWDVRAYPRPDEDDNFRITMGTLHAATEEGYVYVTVGALMAESGTAEPEEYATRFLDLLRDSEAIDTLYSHARQQALVLAAATGLRLDLPDSFNPASSVTEAGAAPEDDSDDRAVTEGTTEAE